MASYFYTSSMYVFLWALFVIQTLEFSYSKAFIDIRCIGIEKEALLKLKQDFTNPSKHLWSWIGENCCEWEGVECHKRTGHVSKLDLCNPYHGLVKCNLKEWLDPINMLSSLEYLILRGCILEDALTSLHVNFISLRFLDLSNNFMNSSIPPWFLKNLKIIDVFYNNFNGNLPNQFGNFKDLEILDSSFNLILRPIPASVGQLSSLIKLHLSSNRLSGNIPKKLMPFGNNQLDGVISEIHFVNLTRLTKLYISSNEIVINFSTSWIPPFHIQEIFMSSFKDLSKNMLRAHLQWISSGDNKFNVQIPSSLCNLEQLQVLGVQGNDLNRYLCLVHNNLSGRITHCFNNFHECGLIPLFLHTSDSLCSFPLWLIQKEQFTTKLQYLYSIDLSSNALDGQISKGLTRLARLQNFNLSQNNLVGEIPSNIGNSKNLESLDLSNNKLSGEIPSSIVTLDFLSCLELSFNNLFGSVPLGNHLSTLDNQHLKLIISTPTLPRRYKFKPTLHVEKVATKASLSNSYMLQILFYFLVGMLQITRYASWWKIWVLLLLLPLPENSGL
ncbi:hypothetical protein BT93_G1093 [Corymbia citriodora subsp. variegata]|nr:hypothetical protein BT93_G1093 [Corymbia citriodora subsp. variegata]